MLTALWSLELGERNDEVEEGGGDRGKARSHVNPAIVRVTVNGAVPDMLNNLQGSCSVRPCGCSAVRPPLNLRK